MPALSMIVLTRNRPERCADSIRRNAEQVEALDAEILLINNGGSPFPLPGTPRTVPLRRLDLDRNTGVAARNDGIAATAGEVILFLDDDAYIRTESVAAMLEVLRHRPEFGGAAFRVVNDSGEEGCLLPTVFHGCACAFRRSALVGAGGYPRDFVYYGEEYDLAFRMASRGRAMALLAEAPPVRHARDGGGRDMDQILYRLVRNNAFMLTAYPPAGQILAALRDTLQRFRAVADKERAIRGWRRGMAAVPGAVLRGLARRQPLDRVAFETLTLQTAVRTVADRLAAVGARTVVLCGVGKFPSAWASLLLRRGIAVESFLDFNPCWRGRRIGGIPVRVADRDEAPPDIASRYWITGLASRPENERWRAIASRRACLGAAIVPRAENAAGVPIRLLTEPEAAFFAGTEVR